MKRSKKVEALVNVYFGQQADIEAISDARSANELTPEEAKSLTFRIDCTMAEIFGKLAPVAHRLDCGRWAVKHVGVVLAAAMVDSLTSDLWPQQKLWGVCGLNRRKDRQQALSPRAAMLYLDEEFPGQTIFSPADIEAIRERHQVSLSVRNGETIDRDTLIWAMTRKPYSGFLKMVANRIATVLTKDCKKPWGRLYQKRLRFEDSMNQRKAYADQAEQWLKICNNPASAKYYSEGMLPPWQIIGRARRFVAKAFIERFVIMRREEELGERLPDGWVPLDMLPEDKWGGQIDAKENA